MHEDNPKWWSYYSQRNPHAAKLAKALGSKYEPGLNCELQDAAALADFTERSPIVVPPSFSVKKGLALRLLATSIEGLRPCDIHLPYRSFNIFLDEHVLHRPCNFSVVRADEPRLPSRQRDAVVALWGENAIEIYDRDLGRLTILRQDTRLRDQELSEEQLAFAQFVLNLCLYIESTPSSVRLSTQPDIDRLSSGPLAKRTKTKERIARLKRTQAFEVGNDVVIDPKLEEALFGEGRRTWSLNYRTLVRGHWRNQAHGEGRLQRKMLWIEPHIRGSDGPLMTHNYSFPDDPDAAVNTAPRPSS